VAVVNCAEMDGARLQELAWALEKTGTDLYVAPALLDVAERRTTIRPVAGLPLLHLGHATLTGHKLLLKSAVDRVLAALALIVLAPALAVLAWAIRRDGGPALFRHTRIGKNGLPFTLYKFRSMVVNADERKAELEALNEVNGVLFKIRRDPRLTPLGAWMRRWSLDEIPQLLNVVRGEMSLVGPRPWAALPYEKAATSGEGSQSSPGSPACGRLVGAPTCPGRNRCGSMSGTSRTGRWSSTCRSSGRRSGRCCAASEPTKPWLPCPRAACTWPTWISTRSPRHRWWSTS
jgi:lipopolysaccharide/colanic/teichoic acid biosynthesis glycosyltransferase